MRLITLALILSLFTFTETDSNPPLPPAEALEQIGKSSVLVEMLVKKSKDRLEKRGIIYLDSEDDYTDPKNLGIAISAEAAAEFKALGIDDPAAHFLGKIIRVHGCVMRFEDRPYLPVHDPEQITIAKKP